jgi:asparagine synthase (glutamine-hydrolysing)
MPPISSLKRTKPIQLAAQEEIMSAITGIVQLQQKLLPPEAGSSIMTALQRFPADYVHTWSCEDVFLGCHGQWITPESLHEQLPHFHPESEVAITADAIIDNRDELFGKLNISAEHRKEMTDSNLILLAYLKWGHEAPKHLIGDFAFIIWDSKEHSLFGARDFSGSRTLYYAATHEQLALCTTISPLLALSGINRQLNDQWVSEFLAIPITTEAVDMYSTVYKHIGQIPPAHSFTLKDGRLHFSRYCIIEPEQRLRLKSNDEYEEAFRHVFQTAVSSRLRTFREVGANLSGGLDSGSVVSFAARELRAQQKQLHTYSYVPVDDFRDWTPKSRIANERHNIKATVSHVGNIDDHYFNFPEMNPLTEVDDWLDIMETPYKFFENSYWMKGIYKQAQAHNVGVLLTGSRGNWTVSWGPALDFQARLLRSFRWLKLYRELKLYSKDLGVKKSRIFPHVGRKAFPEMSRLLSAGKEAVVPDLINPDFAAQTKVYERLKEHGYDFWGHSWQNVYDVRHKQFEKLYYWSLTGTVGCKQSLRHSLWERDATNDLRVIRFCLSVPEEQYVQNGFDRSLIRRATKNYLPDQIRLNQKVRGIQGADGLHRLLPEWRMLMSELQQVVEEPAISGYLNTQELSRALKALSSNPKPEQVFETEFRILMRALIFCRFMKKLA